MDQNRLIMSVETDFQYIAKVVTTCENYLQLQTTKTLFENFKTKWNKQVPKMDMINYMYRFESTYESRKMKL